MTAGLFPEPAPGGPEAVTAGERRRARQAAAVAQGQHPLSATLRTPIRLHPDAARQLHAETGPRCGTCAYRHRLHGGARNYPKCTAGSYVQPGPVVGQRRYPRATHGEATDVRKAWPACEDYAPEE